MSEIVLAILLVTVFLNEDTVATLPKNVMTGSNLALAGTHGGLAPISGSGPGSGKGQEVTASIPLVVLERDMEQDPPLSLAESSSWDDSSNFLESLAFKGRRKAGHQQRKKAESDDGLKQDASTEGGTNQRLDRNSQERRLDG